MSFKFGLAQFYNQKKRLLASLQPAPVLCLFMIAVLWTVLFVILAAERQRTLDSAIQQGGNLVRLFHQNTAAMFNSVDRTLLLLREKYEEDAAQFDFRGLLQRSVTADNLSTTFAFADQYGNARSLTPSDGIVTTAFLGDRKYFQQQRDAAADRLLVGGPLISRLSHK